MKTEQTGNCSRTKFWLPMVKTVMNVGRYPVPFCSPVLKNRRTVSMIVPCAEYLTWTGAVCGSNLVQYLNVAQHKTVWILPYPPTTFALCAVSLYWRLTKLFLLYPPFHLVAVLVILWVQSMDWGGDWYYCEFSQWTEGVTGITVSSVNGLRGW